MLLIPAAGGTLITGDALQNWTNTKGSNLLGAVVMRMMGFIKPYNVGPGWVKALKPDREQVRGILELDFENVLPGHGDVVMGAAKALFRPAIERYANG